jgi:hypothetical protein
MPVVVNDLEITPGPTETAAPAPRAPSQALDPAVLLPQVEAELRRRRERAQRLLAF